jgi:hypothetical protein
VNGFKGPNTIGKDIFYFFVLADGIKPYGSEPVHWSYNQCSTNLSGQGRGCAAWALQNIDYY